MKGKMSCGVMVQITPIYQPHYSNPHEGEWYFNYVVVIVNYNLFPIQILERIWVTANALSEEKATRLKGVFGQQPTIEPKTEYVYQSGVTLDTSMGRLRGRFAMLDVDKNEEFDVAIPLVKLEAEEVCN